MVDDKNIIVWAEFERTVAKIASKEEFEEIVDRELRILKKEIMAKR